MAKSNRIENTTVYVIFLLCIIVVASVILIINIIIIISIIILIKYIVLLIIILILILHIIIIIIVFWCSNRNVFKIHIYITSIYVIYLKTLRSAVINGHLYVIILNSLLL